MKTILLFLIATLAHADIYIQRLTSEQTGDGYMFQFVQDGVVYCWGMPDVLDPAFIPQLWTPVTQAAIDYRWPVMTGAAEAACLTGPRIPRTIGGAIYTINYLMRVEVLDTIPAGIPCGDKIMWFGYFRAVTYNGMYGFAVCR